MQRDLGSTPDPDMLDSDFYSFEVVKMSSKQWMTVVEDCASECYGVVGGWLTFGSDGSGSIPSTAISHIILHQPSASRITGTVPTKVGDGLVHSLVYLM